MICSFTRIICILFLHEDTVMHESHVTLVTFFFLTAIKQPSWICAAEGACDSCWFSDYGYRRIPWYVSHSYKTVLITPSSRAGWDGLHDALSHPRKPCSLIITMESLNNSVWNRPQEVCGVTSFLCQDNTRLLRTFCNHVLKISKNRDVTVPLWAACLFAWLN